MSRYECPPNFREEEILGQLYLEDIDEDCELWLVRMPADIDLTDLDKNKVSLDQECNSFETKGGKVLECLTDFTEIPNLCAVLPRKEDQKLRAVNKVFRGSMLITETLRLIPKIEIKSEIEAKSVDQSIDESIDQSIHESATLASNSKLKKNKKKSKDREKDFIEQENPEYMDISQENFRSPTKKSRVKTEPLSSNMDDFPDCVSQTQM